MNNELNPPGFNPEEQEWYHTEDVYDENDDYIGWKYILDENGSKIPLGICLCHAHSPTECESGSSEPNEPCGCACNSWTDNDYDYDDDYWYDEQLDWEEHREMSFGRHLENF